MVAFPDWLLRDQERRTVLCEMDYRVEDAGVPETRTLYLSNRPYIDNVAPRRYDSIIARAPSFTRTLTGDNRNTYQSSFGNMELDNSDGEADYILVLAVTELRFYFGDFEWPVADFAHIFTCMCRKIIAPSRDRLSVQLMDVGVLLNKTIGGDVLVGGSGPESGRYRPKTFGYVHQLPCYLLDEASLTYIWADDGTYLQNDPGVFEPTVREGGTPTTYSDNGNGTFTLAAQPIKQITSDLLNTPAGSPAYRCVSDALSFVIEQSCGLGALGLYVGAGPTYEVHPSSGVAAWVAAGGEDYFVGFALTEKTGVIGLLNELTMSGHCFWASTRLNEFTFGRLRPNDIDALGVTPKLTLRKDDIDVGTLSIDKIDPTFWRLNVRVDKNYVQQSDFVDELSLDQRSYLSRPGLDVAQYPMAGDTFVANPQLYLPGMSESPYIETLLSDGTDIVSESNARLWMGVKRANLRPWLAIISARTGIDRYDLELGDVLPIVIDTEATLGLSTEKNTQVVGHTIDLQTAKVGLQLLCQLTIEPGEETEEVPPDEVYIPLPSSAASARVEDPNELPEQQASLSAPPAALSAFFWHANILPCILPSFHPFTLLEMNCDGAACFADISVFGDVSGDSLFQAMLSRASPQELDLTVTGYTGPEGDISWSIASTPSTLSVGTITDYVNVSAVGVNVEDGYTVSYNGSGPSDLESFTVIGMHDSVPTCQTLTCEFTTITFAISDFDGIDDDEDPGSDTVLTDYFSSGVSWCVGTTETGPTRSCRVEVSGYSGSISSWEIVTAEPLLGWPPDTPSYTVLASGAATIDLEIDETTGGRIMIRAHDSAGGVSDWGVIAGSV